MEVSLEKGADRASVEESFGALDSRGVEVLDIVSGERVSEDIVAAFWGSDCCSICFAVSMEEVLVESEVAMLDLSSTFVSLPITFFPGCCEHEPILLLPPYLFVEKFRNVEIDCDVVCGRKLVRGLNKSKQCCACVRLAMSAE